MASKSGAGAQAEGGSSCAYFRQLSFLTDTIGNRPTTSNIMPPTSSALLSPHQSPPLVVKQQRSSLTNFTVTSGSSAPKVIPRSQTSPAATISHATTLSSTTSSTGSFIETPHNKRDGKKRKDNINIDLLLTESLTKHGERG